MTDIHSPYYPYVKVHPSYFDLSASVDLPKKICDYLLDAPGNGYTPQDDNTYPRCRFWKYLFYDGANPLSEPLPGITEKMSVLFDPSSPENPPSGKGYRLIPQAYIKPAQTDAQTCVYCYCDRTVPTNNEFTICLSVVFLIWTHYTYESNTETNAMSRTFALEQALIEAFHGVNMDGIGTFFFSREKHPDCGSRVIYDKNTNVGRQLTFALEISTTERAQPAAYENSPFLNASGTLRMG